MDIDESGVSRLQTILTENRTLAESLSSAFDAASESFRAFREQVATDLPTLFSGSGYGNVTENLFGSTGGLKISLNMTEPKKEIASFTSDVKKPIGLTANASAIVSAARTALENVRSLFSETFILNVRANASTSSNSDNSNSRNDSRNRDDTGSAFQRMSTGGRFSRPTSVEVAEDGDAEYIIPVKKESRALPLLQPPDRFLGGSVPTALRFQAEFGGIRSGKFELLTYQTDRVIIKWVGIRYPDSPRNRVSAKRHMQTTDRM